MLKRRARYEKVFSFQGDLLHSPRVIFEVLSASAEISDRTWKLQNYLALPTMEEYILVNTKALKMEMYRKENGANFS